MEPNLLLNCSDNGWITRDGMKEKLKRNLLTGSKISFSSLLWVLQEAVDQKSLKDFKGISTL